MLAGTYSILEFFSSYLKQYKVHFNYSFQHLKYVVQFFKTIMIDCFTQFPSYNYCSFYSKFISFLKIEIIVKILLNYQKAKLQQIYKKFHVSLLNPHFLKF
jgi:hypothetical protein